MAPSSKAAIYSCRKFISLIPVRCGSNISSAWQTNTATSIRLRLRLNTPANLKDTGTYSPQTHTSSPLRHISLPAVAPLQTSPRKLLADGDLRWMGYLAFMFLIRTISTDVFLIKPLMEIDLSQRHSSAVEAEAYRLLFCQHLSYHGPHNDSTHSNSSQCRLGFRHHSMRWEKGFFCALVKDSFCILLFIGYSYSNIFVKRRLFCSFPPLNPLCELERFMSVHF